MYLKAHPLCLPCDSKGLISAATIVDHIIPHKGDQRLFWDSAANWQPICKPCHDKKTWRERVEGGNVAVEQGQRVVVCGPPNAGKSTWVKAQAKPGDIVWDLDDIASLIGYQGQETRAMRDQRSWAVSQATLAMREGLLAWLSTAVIVGSKVYLIVSNATQAEQVAQRVHAEVVHIQRESRRG